MSLIRTGCLIAAAVTLLVGCQRLNIGSVQITTNVAKVWKEEVTSRTFPTVASPTVVVDVFSGAITVTRGPDGTVAAEVTKRGGGDTEEAAADMLKKFDVQLVQDGDTVHITAKVPKGESIVGEAPAKLTVPAGASLDLRTAFGAVGVTGINGPIDVRTSNGAVTVRDGTGPAKLVSSFGDIYVHGRNTTVAATTSNGAITVREAAGELTLSSTFGKIEVDAPATAVTATTSNGQILLKQATGPLQLKSLFGDVRVETPGGEVTAETSNGTIHVRGATGRVKLHSTFGDVDVAADKAVVTAESNNGAVKFAGTLADGEHTLRSSFGDVTVTLPADARFRLDARTSFGSIATGFPVATTGKPSKSQVQGTVGDSPAVFLKLSTNNGGIRVNPAKEKDLGPHPRP